MEHADLQDWRIELNAFIMIFTLETQFVFKVRLLNVCQYRNI